MPASDPAGRRPIGGGARAVDDPSRRSGWRVARRVAENPFLTLVLVALLLRFGLPMVVAGFHDGVIGLFWRSATWVLGPFSGVATWIDPWLRGFPEWVDSPVTLLLGVLPYAAVDAVIRWGRRRLRRQRMKRGPAGSQFHQTPMRN